MQFNYYFLKALSKELETQLTHKVTTSIFSQNKNELVLCFSGGELDFIIKANLDSQVSLLSFPGSFARARKNSIDLFSELLGLTIVGVRQFNNERSFSILFENHFELLFKLHGRHANILLYQQNRLKSIFKKSIEKDLELDLNALDRDIDQSNQAILDAKFDLFQVFPTFDKHIKNRLKALGFYEKTEQAAKFDILNDLLYQLNDNNFYILKDTPDLRLFQPDEAYDTFTSPITASNHLARYFFTKHEFNQLKTKLLNETNKEIKKCQSYIEQNQKKLVEIENRRGYDEIANVLMANLHQKINPSDTEIELFDFYKSEQIKIKLKPNLSLQLNAENLYRKAKNQSKEIQVLKRNIENKEKKLVEFIYRKSEIESCEDIKTLKTFEKPVANAVVKEQSQFMLFDIGGFQVLAGKNAKNNDLLTQKFARKDDLWLHARDVSGSHVIIRNPNNITIPIHVIEKVAQLAAWHSKRKSDTLCPVIYTPKKFVRKPKGALPGQVLLAKEEVILVEPKRLIE